MKGGATIRMTALKLRLRGEYGGTLSRLIGQFLCFVFVFESLLTSDRILSFTGGPQEGTYFIQPKHMNVRFPRNIDDDDLNCVDVDFDRPLEEPTSMSYSLQRIHLANICRSVVDFMPTAVSDLKHIDYKDVIFLDSRFEHFLLRLPVFLRLDEESRQKSLEIDQKFPQVEVQRYLLGLAIHNRRCKLHRPFLLQCSHEPRYIYSRKICLESARAIFQVRRFLENGSSSFASAHLRLCAVVHYVFMATVVLVMDLCFNRIEEEEEQRKDEVINACRILEEAKGQSAIAGRLLESLMAILRKHKIRLRNPSPVREANGRGSTTAPATEYSSHFEPAPPSHEPIDGDNAPMMMQEKQLLDIDDSPLREIWQDYAELGPHSDVIDWDRLFSDLDSHVA